MLLQAGHGHSRRALGLATALGFLLVGCAGSNTADKVRQGDQKVAAAPANGAATTATRTDPQGQPTAPTKTTPPPQPQPTAKAATPAAAPPRNPLDEGRVVGVTPSGATITRVGQEEPEYPSEQDMEQKREEASDMIYALIRVRMEEAIIKRKSLLESGRASSDVDVRRLENVIINARQYLEEDGEIVAPVDPPIIQTLRPGNKTP